MTTAITATQSKPKVGPGPGPGEVTVPTDWGGGDAPSTVRDWGEAEGAQLGEVDPIVYA
jgi:hypothetical protein